MRRLLLIVGLAALIVALGLTAVPLISPDGTVVEVFPLDPEVLSLSLPGAALSASPLPPAYASISSVAVVQQGLDGYDGCVDTYIQFYMPDDNYCDGHELSLGSTNKAALLLRFDLTELPDTAFGLNAESVVQEATLSLYGIQGTKDTVIGAYMPGREWDPCTVTWNEPWQQAGADGAEDRGAEPLLEVQSPRMPNWIEFQVTELVQNWLSDPATNRGVMIKSFDIRWPSQHIFFSSNHPATTSRPKLTIRYEPVRATRTPVSPTVAPTTEPTVAATAEPTTVVPPDQPLGPRVVEIQWYDQMTVGDSHELTVLFRSDTVVESQVGGSSSHALSVAAHLTAPSFDATGDSPTEQVLEDVTSSLSWSWAVTPRMTGSQPVSLDLLFTWRPVVGASTETSAEPGMWYVTKTVEVDAVTADTMMETVRNALAIVGLLCIAGYYVLRWRELRA